MKAILKNYRQSPRKVRLIADLIRGKKANQAEILLKNSVKDASSPVLKLLQSAISNAENQGFSKEDLKITEIKVDGGVILKRMMPRARGSAFLIRKRTSKITLNLTSDSLANKEKIETKTVKETEEKGVQKKSVKKSLNKKSKKAEETAV